MLQAQNGSLAFKQSLSQENGDIYNSVNQKKRKNDDAWIHNNKCIECFEETKSESALYETNFWFF